MARLNATFDAVSKRQVLAEAADGLVAGYNGVAQLTLPIAAVTSIKVL